MRRLAGHGAYAEIDAGLAEKHRPQLRMRVGNVQDARIAEAFDVIDAVGAARETRQRGRQCSGTGNLEKFSAADGHVLFPRERNTPISTYFQVLPELLSLTLPDRLRLLRGLRLPLPPRPPCRTRRHRRLSWRPPASLRSGSTGCGAHRPPCLQLPPRHRRLCSRLPLLQARRQSRRATTTKHEPVHAHGRAPGPEIGRPLAT